MTNVETQMSKKARMTKSEDSRVRASCFVIPSSFKFRHSSFLLLALLAFTRSAPAAEWRQIGTLAAPEAHQAAAADEQFVYVVSSTVVARYDRATGKRLAVSHGPAKHLNSAFLWQGKLYCAHSNYPHVPEVSEIKALDLDTMRLTTFKDFGNYGGSLTWCLWHEGRWWCNFARYKSENAETFLAVFDDEWREVRRFRYPKELIDQLGEYSLSGGIFRDGRLLATDHDHQAVYVLELPASGDTLRFVGKQAAPWRGQGIAADPKTGGLVGIQRKTREVLFAELD
jgi:hypothetical protein